MRCLFDSHIREFSLSRDIEFAQLPGPA
jgi:hypothetical protein